jgi:homospermidine synthase
MKPSQIIFIGFGAVARCLFELIPKRESTWTDLPVLIIDPRKDLSADPILQNTAYTDQLTLINQPVEGDTLQTLFDEYVREKAVVFDLSFRVDTIQVILQCNRKGCIYANTSQDYWEEEMEDWDEDDMEEYSLAYMREELREACKECTTTAILNHGMNPGLVSHFAKHAIRRMHLDRFGREASYSDMARNLKLTTIHISERDTQKTNLQVTERSLKNTWSVKGLFDEAIDPVQVSWGTHERHVPTWFDQEYIDKYGQIFFPIRGMQMKLKSYEPIGGMLIGACIPHAESASLARLINQDGYRISVYYVYNLPDVAKVSVHFMENMRDDYDYYVLKSGDILEGGYDAVGCLLFHGENEKLWIGAVQPIERAKELNKEINGTCLQVAVSILAAVKWGLQNPSRGVVDPEEVDTEFVLEYCQHWMGDFVMRDVTGETRELTDQFYDLLVCPKTSGISWDDQ